MFFGGKFKASAQKLGTRRCLQSQQMSKRGLQSRQIKNTNEIKIKATHTKNAKNERIT
jgi:hypothetical protein